MSIADMLDQQLELYERQTVEIDGGKLSADPSELFRQVENAVAFGQVVLDGLRRRGDDWDASIEQGVESFPWDAAKEYTQRFREWLVASTRLMDAVELCRARNLVVADVDEFQEQIDRVSLMSLDADRVRTSIEALERGEGISHEVAMNELRDRLRPRDPGANQFP